MKVSRRRLLSAVSVFGLVLAASLTTPMTADAWVRGRAFGEFAGNPNTIVSSVSGSITCPRTSGQTPCFVHVSAAAITAVGTDVPYEDLEFNWNFGDPTGTEIFVRPTDGASVNANTAQICPEGFYCYRNAGTYTITLTVRYQTALGVYSAVAFTQTITVTAHSPSSTVYYDSNAPGGGDGTTAATAYNTLANLSSIPYWNARRTNHVVKLARGSNWAGSTGCNIRIPNGASLSGSMAGVRVEAYQGPYSASTAKPILNVAGSSDVNDGIPCTLGTGFANGNTKTDFVFSSISFKTTGGTTFSKCIFCNPQVGSTGGWTDMYWDNCDVYSDAANAGIYSGQDPVAWSGASPGGFLERVGMWGGSVTTDLTAASGRRTLIGNQLDRWSAIFGVYLSGSGGFTVQDHFIYPEVEKYSLYKWISIGNTGTGSGQQSFFLNLNYNGTQVQANGYSGGFKYAEFQAISECGNAAGVTNPLQFFCDGEQSNLPAATFAGGGSADITYGYTSVPPVGAEVAFRYDVSGTSVTPSGLSLFTPYYVVYQSGTTIRISATPGGAAITFATAGSGIAVLLSMFRNFVIERCGLTAFSSSTLIYGNQIASLTFRGNRIWGYTGGSIMAPPGSIMPGGAVIRSYKNLVDSPSGLGSLVSYSGNLTNWTQAQQFTDNVIVDRRATTSRFEQINWSSMQGNGSIINRNSFYTDATAAFYDNATSKSFAQQQAAGFDLNSTVQPISSAPWPSAPTSWNGFGA